MDEIFKQSFTYPKIGVYKNYSNIDKHNGSLKSTADNPGWYPLSYSGTTVCSTPQHPFKSLKHDLRLYQKHRDRSFFYLDDNKDFLYTMPVPVKAKFPASYEEIQPYIEQLIENNPPNLITPKKYQVVTLDSFMGEKPDFCFYTDNKKDIKQHYYDPFATVCVNQFERWIKKEENKITMKFYTSTRVRNINCKYFKKSIRSITITFDLQTGDFKITRYRKLKNHISKSFCTNSFKMISEALRTFFSLGTTLPIELLKRPFIRNI